MIYRLLCLIFFLVSCGTFTSPAVSIEQVWDLTPRKEASVYWEIKVWAEDGTPKPTIVMDGAKMAATGMTMRLSGMALNGEADCIEASWQGHASMGISLFDYVQIRFDDDSNMRNLWYGQVRMAPSPDNPDYGQFKAVGLSRKRLFEIYTSGSYYELQDVSGIAKSVLYNLVYDGQLSSTASKAENLIDYPTSFSTGMPATNASLEVTPQGDYIGNTMKLLASSIAGGQWGVSPNKVMWMGVPNGTPLEINLDRNAVTASQNAIDWENYDLDGESKFNQVMFLLPSNVPNTTSVWDRAASGVAILRKYTIPNVLISKPGITSGYGDTRTLQIVPWVYASGVTGLSGQVRNSQGQTQAFDATAFFNATLDGSSTTKATVTNNTSSTAWRIDVKYTLPRAEVQKFIGFYIEADEDLTLNWSITNKPLDSNWIDYTIHQHVHKASDDKNKRIILVDRFQQIQKLYAWLVANNKDAELQVVINLPANGSVNIASIRPIKYDPVLDTIASYYFTPTVNAPKKVTMPGILVPSGTANVKKGGATTSGVRVEEIIYEVSGDRFGVSHVALEQKPIDPDELGAAALDRWATNQATVDAVRQSK